MSARAALVVALLALPFPVGMLPRCDGAETQKKIYWVDYVADEVARANLDGSQMETLVDAGLVNPFGIALDVRGGKMYWSDPGNDTIKRASLDGSNIETLVAGANAYGVAIDPNREKIYWTQQGPLSIRRANLDGSGAEDFVTSGVQVPWAVAVDVEGAHVYWTDGGTRRIHRANLDGTGVIDVLTFSDPRVPIALIADTAQQTLYWSMADIAFGSAGRIQRARFDGSAVTDLVQPSWAYGLGLDPGAGKLYFSEATAVRRCNLDGSGVETSFAAGAGVQGIALDVPVGIPAVSEWALAMMALLLLAASSVLLRRLPAANHRSSVVGCSSDRRTQ